jgi:hypothetical protein
VTTVPTTNADSEWVTKRADQLFFGDRIAGDLLPLGQPGEVIFTRFFERNNSEWMFVAFVQWDGFHDSTTFLASAAVRVRVAEPRHVADPTGLAYSRADDEPDDPTPVSGHRVAPHTGGLTEQGLVDETPPEPVVQCFDGDPHGPHRTVFAPETGIENGHCPGLIVGDTADEQRDNAYAAYERDEAKYLDLPRCPNCHGRHDVTAGCH